VGYTSPSAKTAQADKGENSKLLCNIVGLCLTNPELCSDLTVPIYSTSSRSSSAVSVVDTWATTCHVDVSWSSVDSGFGDMSVGIPSPLLSSEPPAFSFGPSCPVLPPLRFWSVDGPIFACQYCSRRSLANALAEFSDFRFAGHWARCAYRYLVVRHCDILTGRALYRSVYWGCSCTQID